MILLESLKIIVHVVALILVLYLFDVCVITAKKNANFNGRTEFYYAQTNRSHTF